MALTTITPNHIDHTKFTRLSDNNPNYRLTLTPCNTDNHPLQICDNFFVITREGTKNPVPSYREELDSMFPGEGLSNVSTEDIAQKIMDSKDYGAVKTLAVRVEDTFEGADNWLEGVLFAYEPGAGECNADLATEYVTMSHDQMFGVNVEELVNGDWECLFENIAYTAFANEEAGANAIFDEALESLHEDPEYPEGVTFPGQADYIREEIMESAE